MPIRRVVLLTTGGFIPCLSFIVGGLIERYNETDPGIETIAYQNGYYGLLIGNSVVVNGEVRARAAVLHRFGGSPISNSRVKLINAKNLVERGLVTEGENPPKEAAGQLRKDGVDILHTIGGDDTSTTAADPAACLEEYDYRLTVVDLPKTIDSDVVPIRQSLGIWTAAEEVSEYVQNVIDKRRSNPRMLITYEIMGRNYGWLTTVGSREYHEWPETQEWVPSIGLSKERWDIHAVFPPEAAPDIEAEVTRLKRITDEQGNVNIFLSEGVGVPEIIAEVEAVGIGAQRDLFDHVKLDTVNPDQWFAKQFASKIEVREVIAQRSGYFSCSSCANAGDLRLTKLMMGPVVECALRGKSGVIGHDEENSDRLCAILFPRVAGGKPLGIMQKWLTEMMTEIGRDMKSAAR